MDDVVRPSYYVSTLHLYEDENLEDLTLIWLDAKIDQSDDCKDTQFRLRGIVNWLETFVDMEQCVNYIANVKQEKVFFIVSGSYGEQVVQKIHNFPKITYIYVFCHDKIKHEQWTKQYKKLDNRLFDDKTLLLEKVELDVKSCIQNFLPMRLLHSNIRQKTLRDLDYEGGMFMWFQLLIEILIMMEYPNDEAKNDMLEICRKQYQNNPIEISRIEEFKDTYTPKDAIKWYTRDCFLYRLLNKALRIENFDIIYKFRHIISDIYQQLKQMHPSYLKVVSTKENILTVYRGQHMAAEELERLKLHKNGYISMNTFLSTSLSCEAAVTFAGDGSGRPQYESIMFEIDIPLDEKKSNDDDDSIPPFSNINQSFGTVFRIESIEQMTENLWMIKLRLDSKNNMELQEVSKHIRTQFLDEKPSLLNLGKIFLFIDDYDKAEKYYKILLEELSSNHKNLPDVYHHLGFVYRGKGEYSLATEYFDKALVIEHSQSTENNPHPMLHNTYAGLGLLYDSMGDYDLAIDMYRKAMQIITSTELLNEEHMIGIYNNMAFTYRHQGKYEQSLTLYNQILEKQLKLLPTFDPEFAITYNNIALVWSEIGDVTQALSNYEKALEIEKKTLPPEHSTTASTYNNIGILQFKQKNILESLNNFKRSLNIFLKVYGVDHQSVATVYTNMGDVHGFAKEYSEAMKYLEDAIQINLKLLPASQFNLVHTYNIIGAVYYMQQRYTDAIESHQNALKILQVRQKEAGLRERFRVAELLTVTYNAKARSLLETNKWEEAIACQENALEEYFVYHHNNESHFDIIEQYNKIGYSCKHANQLEKAMRMFIQSFRIQAVRIIKKDRETVTARTAGHYFAQVDAWLIAIENYEKILDITQLNSPYDRLFAETYSGIGQTLYEFGLLPEALEMFEKTLHLLWNTHELTQLLLSTTHFDIGNIHFQQEKYDEAAKNYLLALDIELNSSSATGASLALKYQRLGEVYMRESKFDEALECYRKSLKLEADSVSPDHLQYARNYHEIAAVLVLKSMPDDALAYYEKALQIRLKDLSNKNASNNSENHLSIAHKDLASTYYNMAVIYEDAERYEAAIKCHENAVEIYLKCSSNIDLAKTYNYIADAYLSLENEQAALQNYNKALNYIIIEPKSDYTIASQVCKSISAIYREQPENDDHELSEKFRIYIEKAKDFEDQHKCGDACKCYLLALNDLLITDPSNHKVLAETYSKMANTFESVQNIQNILPRLQMGIYRVNSTSES